MLEVILEEQDTLQQMIQSDCDLVMFLEFKANSLYLTTRWDCHLDQRFLTTGPHPCRARYPAAKLL